ncbi:MAG TPA: ATPase, T2SS/T4P/T4SS family [Burkholderiaceae bacterium]|nr:ATPase, T2SS/T4P/T4SS family [Burkholderiaceae bacterium]
MAPTATAPIVERDEPLPALDQIGYEAADLEAIRHAIHAPDGLVLIVGPAGSGRSTALYSMLGELDPLRRRVRTIESSSLRPVPAWRQVQVPDAGSERGGRRWERTFARVLRGRAGAILVEKIATAGVAQLAIQAAQAGQLVLSTMSLGRASSVFAELRRLRVTASQAIDGLSLVIGQRLVGRLCPACSIADDREAVRRALAPATNTWLAGRAVHPRRAAPSGCAACGHCGYQGRVLAYELVEIDNRARSLIASGIDPVELERALLAEGGSIWDRGLKRVADGMTSLEALLAAVRQPR